MNTRSQTKKMNLNMDKGLYKFEINFDEASEAWRANKKSIGNGHYKYICCSTTKSGNSCKRESVINSDYPITQKL